jgi:hypothetical protein
MKKILKPLIIGLVICSAALAAGVLMYAELYLTPKVVENTLTMEIQGQLQRQVSFREIEVGLFKGIILRGVTVHKEWPWEKSDLFTCDEIAMSVGFAPLLLKKLVIRSLAITNPRMHIQSARGRPFSLYGNAKPPAKTGTALELLVLPGSFMVSGGTVSWLDQAANPSMQLTNLRLEAGSMSFILPFDVTGSASLFGGTTPDVQLKGSCFIPAQKFSAELTVPEIDFSRLKPYLTNLDIPLNKGVASLSLTAKSSGGQPLQAVCKASLKNAAVVLVPAQAADDEIGLEGFAAAVEIQADVDPATGDTAIKKIQGSLLSSPFEGSGSIRSAGIGPAVRFHLAADRLSLEELSTKLYYGAASPFKGMRLTGLVGLGMDMGERSSGVSFPTITLNLRNNRIVYPPFGSLQPELSGTLTLDSRAITVTNVRIGTSALGLVFAGTIANYMTWPPQNNLRLVSSDFNFYQFFNAPAAQQGEDIGPFDFGALKFDGKLDLGNVTFLTQDLTGVQGVYSFEKNRFSIWDFAGGITKGGRFSLSSGIDFAVKGFDYRLKLLLTDVLVQTLGELAGASLSEFIDGTVTGSISLRGFGTKPATFADSLTGDATFQIKDCRVKGFAMPEQLNRFIKKGELRTISFTDSELRLKLRRAGIELSGEFISPKAELHPFGEIRFNTELNVQAKLKLATDIFSRETRIVDYLPREGSWVVLPMVIRGTLDSPSVTLTDDGLRYIVQETLPRLFLDMLEKTRPPAAPESADDR